ncbi:MAG TPA: hypothetical protein VN823_28365 [Stellaceae bacterium]|nr:hypothetical protein [Stellaceae bacterium]
MTDRNKREKPKSKTEKDQAPKKPAGKSETVSDEALDEVAGGLNPQPLPPRWIPT